MLQEVDLKFAYRATPTGLYLISTSLKGKRNVQFAFRALGISDQPPLLVVGIQHKNYSLGIIHETEAKVKDRCTGLYNGRVTESKAEKLSMGSTFDRPLKKAHPRRSARETDERRRT